MNNAVPVRPMYVLAPAKLTLSLHITGVRADGYHLLDAEMVTVDLCDRLEIGPGDGLEVTGGSGLEAPSGLEIPTGDTNLVRRALAVAGRRAFVRLHKRIPAGAGLGGGSADAAAVLRWAGVTDLDKAAGLGADVPFCLVGGRARVRGVGEQVDPLPFDGVDGHTYTLLTPPFGVSTQLVYQAWDELGGPRSARPSDPTLSDCSPPDPSPSDRGPSDPSPNDLEAAALRVEPRLAVWRDRLGAATGQTPVLAGSGSTWFVPGAYPGEDRVVVTPVRPGPTGAGTGPSD